MVSTVEAVGMRRSEAFCERAVLEQQRAVGGDVALRPGPHPEAASAVASLMVIL